MKKNDIGLIGLAVMGQNLVLNLADKGFKVVVYNRTAEVTKKFLEDKGKNPNVTPSYSLEEMLSKLERPRKIILLVKAGDAVDKVTEMLFPLLDRDDLIIDAGNSYFKDTQKRIDAAEKHGINFLGMGISGGEQGALLGPSIMLGGDKKICNDLLPILNKIAAQKPEPCVDYLGNSSSGHYVKMVHNGIEYADMQLIAEIYDVAQNIYGMDNVALSELFFKLNQGELNSYLIEITAKIFNKKDEDNSFIIDKILDCAEEKGTGKWTLQEALEVGVAIPTIASAIQSRHLSMLKKERQEMSLKYPRNSFNKNTAKLEETFNLIEGALLSGKILSYIQGMQLLSKASEIYDFNLKLSSVAKIWRGGCIIRAKILDKISGS